MAVHQPSAKREQINLDRVARIVLSSTREFCRVREITPEQALWLAVLKNGMWCAQEGFREAIEWLNAPRKIEPEIGSFQFILEVLKIEDLEDRIRQQIADLSGQQRRRSFHVRV